MISILPKRIKNSFKNYKDKNELSINKQQTLKISFNMKAQNFLLQTICSVLIFTTTCNAQYHYPPTKTVDSSDTYFGVTYKDPFQWLENMKDPEVVSWFKQQANFSDSILNKISGRDELIAEWKKLVQGFLPGSTESLLPPMQNGTISGKPVLMKVNYDNGHFTEDLSVTFANSTDMFAFALWQCGDKNFQMK